MSTLFDIDHWREVLHALGAKPMRTFMTALGVFWGILLLVIMLGAGDGLKNGVLQNYSDATNSFFLWTQETCETLRPPAHERGSLVACGGPVRIGGLRRQHLV